MGSRPSAAPAAEPVIHANEHGLDVLFDAIAEARKEIDILKINDLGAEAHVVVFDGDRPIGHDHPFDAAAEKPAGTARASRCIGRIERRVERSC